MRKILFLFLLTWTCIIGFVIYMKLPKNPINRTETSRAIDSNRTVQKASIMETCEKIQRIKGETIYTNMTVPSWAEIEKQCSFVLPGGHYKPNFCETDNYIALIIPYRNRETQLRLFLRHIHPFMKNQLLNYRIFVIEMVKDTVFNRGALFNAGFIQAKKFGLFDCIILHDVDLLPEDRRNNYTCTKMPLHLAAAIDKFRYRQPYPTYFGGAVAINSSQYQAINGFSNLFYGWGGEDDDLNNRVLHNNMTVKRYSALIARYKMVRHTKDQPVNQKRFKLLQSSKSRMSTDGLNSIHYNVLKVELRPLYTWILVSISQANSKNETSFQ